MGEFDTVMIYLAAILATALILALYWFQVAGRRFFASASNCFMVWQIVFLAGTLLAVDLRRGDDLLWLFVIVGGMFCFTIGAIIANRGSAFQASAETDRFTHAGLTFDLDSQVYYILVLGMALICTAAGIVFSLAVGYNVFFWAVGQALTNGSVDAATYSVLRVSIGKEGYVAVGYTVQFTSILLPLILYLMFFRVRQTRRVWEISLAVALLLADIYFLTIKGGRVWFIYGGLCFFLLISPFGPIVGMWRAVRKTAVLSLVGLILVYGLATVFTGHAGTSSGNPVALVGSLAADVYNRSAGIQAENQLVVMRYLIALPTAWGSEWRDQIVSILPVANKSYGLGQQLLAYLYNGNDRGGFGLTIWGSLLYNWGAPVTLFLSFFIGFLIQRFTIMQMRSGRLLSHVVVLFVAGFYLGTISDPYRLFLNGFVTLLIYFALVRLVEDRRLLFLRALLRPSPREGAGIVSSRALAAGATPDSRNA